ncbi:MAG: ADP-dependent NAD(P)H-hydrate dehydratase [Candidatus Eremiobacteraeota bacterium]|nr:ADP-dependent NAD(P)H-hydrate dehydratase [Candidatus Eremiobacteraeota bacterium]
MPASNAIDAALLRTWPLPVPDGGDKNARGSIFVVAGAPQMPGAAILCATATLRAGAGKLQIGTCASVAAHVATAVPESLVVALDETPSGAIVLASAATIVERANKADALVIGPGLVDERASARLIAAVACDLDVPAVIDAAALACLRDQPDAIARLGGRVVLTPHAGEMARMLSCERDAVEGDAASFAIEAARRFNAVVALKGETTYIAEPGGALYRNEHGNVGLATSGSGDVLAGVIGGLLARGAEPLVAAAWGVYLHARAGDALAKRIGFGFLARELSAEIPKLMGELSV